MRVSRCAPIRLDTVVKLPEHPVSFGVFITPATADQLDLEYRGTTAIASTMTMPTTEQTEALRMAIA